MAAITGISAFAATMMVITVAASYYQQEQARKAQEKARRAAEEAQDAAKGQEVSVEGESISLPVIYGRVKYSGARVWHAVDSKYIYSQPPVQAGFGFNSGEDIDGSKNEFLYFQQALCHGGITSVSGGMINDMPYDQEEFKYGYRVDVDLDGGVSPGFIQSISAERASASFPNIAYASCVFRLNRDDPQYQGVPNLALFIFGMKVNTIVKSGVTYSLSPNKVYSNNPAYCLLDYLLNTKYGRGCSIDEIDLKSFYDSAQICARVVHTYTPKGELHRNSLTRSLQLPLYECNLVINTESSVRDNITRILDTMDNSDLVWSAGKYKLKLQYPSNLGDIVVADSITDEDILMDSVTVSYQTASERMNMCTIRYSDEELDFKETSVSWPSKGSLVHQQLLAEDNNVPLEKSMSYDGITTRPHAMAKAEFLVRTSRTSPKYSFSIFLGKSFYEPGDILLVNSEAMSITQEYLLVKSIEADDSGRAKVTAVKYDPAQLAWNAPDDRLVPPRAFYEFKVYPVENLAYTATFENEFGGFSKLTWDVNPSSLEPDRYQVSALKEGSTSEIVLGYTSDKEFPVYGLNAGHYTFKVIAYTNMGAKSTATQIGADVTDGTEIKPTFTVSDSILNLKSDIVTKLTVRITSALLNMISGFEVRVSLRNYDATYNTPVSLGVSSTDIFELLPVQDGAVYKVESRVITKYGKQGQWSDPVLHTVVGKLAPPDPVTDLSVVIENKRNYLLTWKPSSAIDIDSYDVYLNELYGKTLVGSTRDAFFRYYGNGDSVNFSVIARDTSSKVSTEVSIGYTRNTPTITSLRADLVGENLEIVWTYGGSDFDLDFFEVWRGSTKLTEIKGTSLKIKADWVGSETFKVRAIDAIGTYSPFKETNFTISVNPPESFYSQVVDNNVLLYWKKPSNMLPIAGFKLSKEFEGTVAEVGLVNSEFSTIFETKSGQYLYKIQTVDSAGNLSEPVTTLTVVDEPPDYKLAVDYYTDFSGTLSSMALDDGKIAGPFDTSISWDAYFSSKAYLNMDEAAAQNSIYLSPSLLTGYYEEVFDYGQVLPSMKVTISTNTKIIRGSVSVSYQIGLSENGIDYTYYNSNNVYGSNFRFIKFRVTFNASDKNSTIEVSQINLVLDAKKKTYQGTTSVATTGTQVSLLGKGFVDVTNIQVTSLGSTPVVAVYDFEDVPSPTHFIIYCFNPQTGAAVSGLVDYVIGGY